MTDDYLTPVLEEAEHVAEQHDQVAHTADNQAYEYLRYAVLRILEGQTDHLPTDWTPIDGVTVGHGSDGVMFDSWDASEDWWETVSPQEACTRFRVFCPNNYQTVPRNIVDVMAALGAWHVWTGSTAACGSYDHRERRELHFLWSEGRPVEERLHERLAGPAEAVAPDIGRTGDVRDWLVVDDEPQLQGDLEPRTKRAIDEAMDVSLLSKGGRYEVQSTSGNRYEVESENQPDDREPDGAIGSVFVERYEGDNVGESTNRAQKMALITPTEQQRKAPGERPRDHPTEGPRHATAYHSVAWK